jgi:hypothetical protein
MISKDENYGTMKQVIGHLESFLLIWRKLFWLPLRDVNQHSSQPENHLIPPTLEIDTIKNIWFE